MNKYLGISLGWCREREKIDWQEPRKFDCWMVRTIFIFCCPPSFSQVVGEWPENQILISDWFYFHCPGVTLVSAICNGKKENGTPIPVVLCQENLFQMVF